jgi:hypothetical protein
VGEQRNGGRFEIAEVDGSLEREPPDEPSRGACVVLRFSSREQEHDGERVGERHLVERVSECAPTERFQPSIARRKIARPRAPG